MRGRTGSVLAALVSALALPTLASAQVSNPTATEVEVAARSLQAQIGLMSGLGSEVPGSPSTLGKRLGTTPRVAASIRAGFMRGAVPDLGDAGGAPSRELTYMLPSVIGGVAVGLFDGLSPVPTLGGIFSIDALGSIALVLPPTSDGFSGKATSGSLGVRVGLLRESFSVPGVAVSVTRRWIGAVSLGDSTDAARSFVTVNPNVTAFRATVGKDLLSVGVLAGVGWERYGGSFDARYQGDSGQMTELSKPLEQSRRIYFGGASMNFLVLQLSAELGWADGFAPVPGYLGAPFDITARDFFGSLAFRLTI